MKSLLLLLLPVLLLVRSQAQTDSTFLHRLPTDTANARLNMDAVYNRPFLQAGKMPVALGGYVESKAEYLQTAGISEGFSFQMQRTTLFVSSSLHPKIRFLSEIEFEEGTKEINIEFASLDLRFHDGFNYRCGILMNPIGAFNQNHDGPKWEFNDRPLSATQLLPATFSNVGMGAWGKYAVNSWLFAYEAYLTNGFDDQVIQNPDGKTFLPASKRNPNRFEESFNGSPLFTGKVAVRCGSLIEVGVSAMRGIYNTFQEDGIVLDKKRAVMVWALDANATLPVLHTRINGEWAWIGVDVPETYSQQFGSRQQGGFVDIVQPVLNRRIFGFDKAVVNVACRLEYVDWNTGTFRETGGNIGDQVWGIVPAVSFRPSGQTVLRLNYRLQSQTDLLNNPAIRTGGFQFGVASYF